MLNAVRAPLARLLGPTGKALVRLGVTPDAITLTGTFGSVVAALWLLPTGHLVAGSIVCAAFVLFDLFDGLVARAGGGGTLWGAFLDSSLDRVSDAAIFVGLALWWLRGGDDELLGLLALWCLVAGSVTSYVKARAEGLGLVCTVGIAERSERLIVILASAGFGALFGWYWLSAGGLWLLAAASTVTVVQRVLQVRGQAAGRPAPPRIGPTSTGSTPPAP